MISEIITNFHFLRPWWFLALLPLAWLIWRMHQQVMSQQGWTGIIDEALLPHVLISQETRSRRWPKILVGVMGFISIIALAGPVWKQLPQPVYRNESALVIALDLSRSMNAADLKPSRLARARFKIVDLLKKRQEGETALLVYASDAYTVTPLTNDTETIRTQLTALSSNIMPRQGSRADRALTKASELLEQAGVRTGDVLLITDGVEAERDGKVAAELRNKGYRVHVSGIGTQEGAPIPDAEGYFTDQSGNIVMSILDEKALKAVAEKGGGIYQKYTYDDHDIEQLMIQFDRHPSADETSDTELKSDQWHEEGPWLLLMIIPFAAFAFRKGYIVLLIFCMAGISYTPVSTARDLWQRPDQKAQDLLEQGKAVEAAELFQDQRWKGSAQYKAGNYEAALKSWENLDDANALYNRGNALAKMGRLEDALEAYKQSIQKKPDHEDAQYNYDQVKKALEKQKKQEGKDKSDQKEKSEGGGGGEDKDGERSESDQASQNDQMKSRPNDQKKQDQSDQQNKQGEQQQGQDSSGSEGQQNKSDQEQQATKDEKLSEGERRGSSSSESQQAVEAALRAIPDDPGGLLRRKFLYQYRQQTEGRSDEAQQW